MTGVNGGRVDPPPSAQKERKIQMYPDTLGEYARRVKQRVPSYRSRAAEGAAAADRGRGVTHRRHVHLHGARDSK